MMSNQFEKQSDFLLWEILYIFKDVLAPQPECDVGALVHTARGSAGSNQR